MKDSRVEKLLHDLPSDAEGWDRIYNIIVKGDPGPMCHQSSRQIYLGLSPSSKKSFRERARKILRLKK